MGIKFDVPGRQAYQVKAIVFDLNGTLAVDGKLRPSTRELLGKLVENVSVYVLTADTHDTASRVRESLGAKVEVQVLQGENTTEAKRAFIQKLGPKSTVAVGNGANDAGMLEEAVLGLAVLEEEGAAAGLLCKADLVVRSIDDALALLLHPRRIVATLRR